MPGLTFLKSHRRDNRNQYFQFHSSQTAFALFLVLLLSGLLAWFFVSPPLFH